MSPQPLGDLRRTHTCGELRASHAGQQVVLLGWVHRVRDLGSLLFVDLRDRYGVTQVTIGDEGTVLREAQALKTEYVIAVIGRVAPRAAEAVNPKLPTGDVEVVPAEIRVLSEARRPPFPIADEGPVTEETRLRYRYLDLRRERMQRNLVLRHRAAIAVREYFDAHGFVEVETPVLGKSTPEGARDYLVPSRVHPGEFYALPQSPQLFKQILMASGLDRYFQIVKCFRDEDLRADRQPEFTQIDVEISFATESLVMELTEGCMARVFREAGAEATPPFPRMTYAEAMASYGSDKPDLRAGPAMADISTVFAASAFTPFRTALDAGGAVRALVIADRAAASRRELDALVEQARGLGAAGLVWVRRTAEGAVQSPALKSAGEDVLAAALEAAGAGAHDLLLLAAGPADATSKLLGQLRLSAARERGLLKPDDFRFLWVTNFPLFEWDAGEGRHVSMHHPFTAPAEADLDTLESAPAKASARAYDLVLNGSEIGGGSIRIHDPAVQARVFRLLGISDEDAKLRFGFFLEALDFGTPPHGGIALGLDRIVALMAGETSIREVMAFPKTAQAVDLMTGAPSTVDAKQLHELALRMERARPER